MYVIEKPKGMREGLANFLKLALNEIEKGNVEAAKYYIEDLLQEVVSDTNHYRIDGPKPKKLKVTP